jgi:hypothetical protein
MGGHWREPHLGGDKVANRRLVERQIEVVASRQQRLISIAQLGHAGLGRNGVSRRVASGRLHRLRRGVYAVHGPPFTKQQRWMAAVLACGPGSLLSDWPAAEHWEITHHPSPAIHITVPGSAGRGASDLVVHRRGPIDPRDIRRKDGIPLTSVDLVLVHLAQHLSDVELEQMLVAADSLKLLKRSRMSELLSQRENLPGTSRLLPLLAQPESTVFSDVELLLIPMYRQGGLPTPLLSHPIPVPGRDRPIKVDLAWPALRLCFELDTQRFHGDWERAEEDRERDQLLALARWLCHRFFRRQLTGWPAEAADRARRLYDLRAALYE